MYKTVLGQLPPPRIIAPPDNCPQDNCPQDSCPPDNGLQKNCPRTIGARIIAPPDNYSRVATLQVIAPQTIAPSWLPEIILLSKIFYYKSFTKNVFSFWARIFFSCIYLITVFDQLLLVPAILTKFLFINGKAKKYICIFAFN